jgi:hypothetical protein
VTTGSQVIYKNRCIEENQFTHRGPRI